MRCIRHGAHHTGTPRGNLHPHRKGCSTNLRRGRHRLEHIDPPRIPGHLGSRHRRMGRALHSTQLKCPSPGCGRRGRRHSPSSPGGRPVRTRRHWGRTCQPQRRGRALHSHRVDTVRRDQRPVGSRRYSVPRCRSEGRTHSSTGYSVVEFHHTGIHRDTVGARHYKAAIAIRRRDWVQHIGRRYTLGPHRNSGRRMDQRHHRSGQRCPTLADGRLDHLHWPSTLRILLARTRRH